MGWQERDWARYTGEGQSGEGPASSFWERPVGVASAAAVVVVLCVCGLAAVRAIGLRRATGVPAAPSLVGAVTGTFETSAKTPETGVEPWPGGVVRIANEATDQEWALERAVAAWNASGAHVQLSLVSPADADVVIESSGPASCGHADATVGDVPGARVRIFARDDADPACNGYTGAIVLAHELGHVLGLGHTTGECSAMNPSGSYRGPVECAPLDPWLWYCRLLEPGDVERAAALYGGGPRLSAERGCPLYTAAGPPLGLQVTAAAGGAVEASFERPPDPSLPPFLAGEAGESSFSASLSPGGCPARPEGAHYRWSGGVQHMSFGDKPPGPYCVAVWAFDGLGRPGSAPAVAAVDVP
jgi:Matrixin